MLSKVADAAMKTAVLGLVGGTCFLGYTTVNQGRFLYERRVALDEKLKDMIAKGEITEEQIKSGQLRAGKGFSMPKDGNASDLKQ